MRAFYRATLQMYVSLLRDVQMESSTRARSRHQDRYCQQAVIRLGASPEKHYKRFTVFAHSTGEGGSPTMSVVVWDTFLQVFEKLGLSLYDFLRKNHYKYARWPRFYACLTPVPLTLIRQKRTGPATDTRTRAAKRRMAASSPSVVIVTRDTPSAVERLAAPNSKHGIVITSGVLSTPLPLLAQEDP
eukprot:2021810-Pyramimonas_sp.AAC.2